MNKKNMNFAFLVAVFTTATLFPIQQLSVQQEKDRIEHIARLSKGSVLSVAQYMLNGSFSNELIEQDIVLLEKDSVEVLNKKSWAEGYMIPGTFKTTGISAVIGSCVAAIATGVGSVFVYKVWNDSSGINFVGKAGLKIANFIEIDIVDGCKVYENYLRLKTEYLMSKSDYNR